MPLAELQRALAHLYTDEDARKRFRRDAECVRILPLWAAACGPVFVARLFGRKSARRSARG